jgi:hypothetical protein
MGSLCWFSFFKGADHVLASTSKIMTLSYGGIGSGLMKSSLKVPPMTTIVYLSIVTALDPCLPGGL